jgi:hypothetical protein
MEQNGKLEPMYTSTLENKKDIKMKNRQFIYLKITLLLGFIFIVGVSCEREVSDDVEFASFPTTAEVFIDGFSGGLEYLPFDGSVLNAFTVDDEIKYKGSASMRFDVPNVDDPAGAFAGAIFPDFTGRDLSGYDALTFWAKGTIPGSINEVGFGNDFGENKFIVTRQNLQLTTNWRKYIIPIPDPSKLSLEKGMFWYAEGPENGIGYTFWIDELKFEKLGTIAQPKPAIFFSEDLVSKAFLDTESPVTGLTQTFNLASGINETVVAAPSYFSFSSSDIEVARVSELGVVSIVGTGSAKITAILGGVKAKGSLTVEVLGSFEFAPVPTRDPNNVISVFSDAYTNIPVDFYNGFFGGQTTLGGAFDINDKNIILYENLNFVATGFSNPTVDASVMTHFHVDIRIDESIGPGDFIRIELVDFGANAAFGGGDDSGGSVTYSSTNLENGTWISLDIPLSNFTGPAGGGAFNGLINRTNIAQIVFASDATISTIFVDNMYFYKE